MAALANDTTQLEGWGSFKRKVGLNKLGTRKAVKAVTQATEGVVKADGKRLKAAAITASQSPSLNVALNTAGNLLAPGVGTAITTATKAIGARQQQKQVQRQVDAYVAKAVAEQSEAQSGANATAADAATTTTTPAVEAPANAAPTWPRWVLLGSAGLLVGALVLRRNEQRKQG